MQRRKAIQHAALIAGTTFLSSEMLLSSCQPGASSGGNDPANVLDPKLLEEIADVIFPDTPDSPGAKKAQVGEFMKLLLEDCYSEEDRIIIVKGLGELEKNCRKEFQSNFIDLKPKDKKAFLVKIDQEARDYEKKRKENEPAHYFTLTKRLSAFAYFSSEIGTTKALRYNPIPGRFEGCVPYKAGEKVWV